MCGLVALHTSEANGFFASDKDEIKQLLIANSLRGSHSTGLAGFVQKNTNRPFIIRAVGNPYELFKYDKSDDFFQTMIAQFTTVIGHGRYATMGTIDAPSAHPFTEGHITLVHNGVISNYNSLKKEVKDSDHITVDSHLIALMISQDGAEKTLGRLEGSFALIWYDNEAKTLNMARNYQRPLFIGKQKLRDTIVVASEKETLIWSSERNRTPLEDIKELPVYEIWTYTEGVIEPVISKFKPYVPPYTRTYTNLPVSSWDREFDDVSGWERMYQQKQLPFNKRPIGNTVSTSSFKELDAEPSEILLLNNIKSQMFLTKNKSYIFQPLDISSPQFHTDDIIVVGTNDKYPNILFSTILPKRMEEAAYNAEFITGECAYISCPPKLSEAYPNRDWKASLINAKMSSLEDSSDWIIIKDYDEIESKILKYRLLEHIGKKCLHCQTPLKQSDLAQTSVIIVDTHGVVCPDCSLAYKLSKRN